MSWRRWWRCGILALGVAALTACAAPAAPETGPPVVVPGRPGETARLMPGSEAEQRRAPGPVSPADIVYVEQMIPHHEQALQMAGLAPGRAEDPQLQALAERIAAVQGPEIAAMTAWLDGQDAAGHSDGQHPPGEHTGMPGMASPAQLDALAASRGAGFDRLFVELMTAHHRGAIAMANDLQTAGTDVLVAEMAQDVIATQGVEMDRMRALLTTS